MCGRDAVLACEELTLRARGDLDRGRDREAALQLEAALSAALAELAGLGDARRPRRAPRRARGLRPGVGRRARAARGAARGALDAGAHGRGASASARAARALGGRRCAARARCSRRREWRGLSAQRAVRPLQRGSTASQLGHDVARRASPPPRASYGVGPIVTSASWPPAASVSAGRPATG